jgi:hypothetical protein
VRFALRLQFKQKNKALTDPPPLAPLPRNAEIERAEGSEAS